MLQVIAIEGNEHVDCNACLDRALPFPGLMICVVILLYIEGWWFLEFGCSLVYCGLPIK